MVKWIKYWSYKISRLGLGGIPIQKIDAEGTKKLITDLIKEGVNFIDTARGYTVSEEYLGYALEGVRDRFVIATKSMSRTKEAMAKDIDVSLKNLRTNYIDLYQIHNPTPADLEQVQAPGGALEALLEAKGIPATIRRELGDDIDGACGQLRLTNRRK